MNKTKKNVTNKGEN